MFDPSAPISAVFDAFGIPVIVLEAVPRTIRALRRMPDDLDRLGSREVLSTSVMLELRASDMGGIEHGARILVDGAMREVRGEPEYRDADRRVAFINTVPVEG